ncbi:MAG: type II toxin-antitoxin system VapB family antitoxin [Bauldia sp.]
MSIKSPETERLIRRLSDLTGKGPTEAVTMAVAEKLSRLEAEKEGNGFSERLAALIDDMASRFKPPFDTIDHGELLYDEKTGLPK